MNYEMCLIVKMIKFGTKESLLKKRIIFRRLLAKKQKIDGTISKLLV